MIRDYLFASGSAVRVGLEYFHQQLFGLFAHGVRVFQSDVADLGVEFAVSLPFEGEVAGQNGV